MEPQTPVRQKTVRHASTPRQSFASTYAWPCSQTPRNEDTQATTPAAVTPAAGNTPATSAAPAGQEAEGGDASRHAKDVFDLRWPTSFCELPRGERLQLTENGACASRSSGVGRAVAFLGPMRLQEPAGVAYFEIEVCELMKYSGTIALGVCTQLPPLPLLTAERASDLGKGFYLIGYDLPKLVVGGSEVSKVNTKQWRPLRELAVRDIVGLLVERAEMRLTVFVNDVRKVSLPMPRGGASQEQHWPDEFWGVVDVYGTLRSVRLRQPSCEAAQSSASLPPPLESAELPSAPIAAQGSTMTVAPRFVASPAVPLGLGEAAPPPVPLFLPDSAAATPAALVPMPTFAVPAPPVEVASSVCEDAGADFHCCTQAQPFDPGFGPHDANTQAHLAEHNNGLTPIEAWAAAPPTQMGRATTAAWGPTDFGTDGGCCGGDGGGVSRTPQIRPSDFVGQGTTAGTAVGPDGAAGADSAAGAGHAAANAAVGARDAAKPGFPASPGFAPVAVKSLLVAADSPSPAAKRPRPAVQLPRHTCGCVVHLIRHTGTVVHVPGSDFVVGRNPKFCNLTLDSPLVPNMVSRRHARIVAENDAVVVVDNGSLNGTFVNGCRVARETLQQGDVVVIGNPAQCPPEFCFSVSMPQTS
eukprot:TRINITY_DN1611_c0_g3_i1.p1 TRINITY_DN1611_c0_g3~~TRINITY_DN1611_c0_g3_i1.p1  ORF type:complete len:640 (+),score=100.88 TRINITY_DN1611_c0_g3_i1:85-2004(+)